MKKFNILIAVAATAVMLMSSCAPNSTLQKDIKYMPIRFKPLSRADIVLVGNLQAEITITGSIGKYGKTLSKDFASNLKEGRINKAEGTEILYFSPGAGESMTGSLYENEVFNNVYGSVNLATQGVAPKKTLFAMFFPGLNASIEARKKLAATVDPGMNFGYYAMVEKYPDIDYFINVRFERKTVLKGSGFTETVIVKADGVKLKTD